MHRESVTEGSLLWQPGEELIQGANISRYLNWLREKKNLDFTSYFSLWEWSVTNIEDFWVSIWEFFDVKASKPYTQVLAERKMPGAKWFTGSELNYTEHVFRNRTNQGPALIFQSELQPLVEISWDKLYADVSSIAAALRSIGVKRGDRIVGYMPNIPETLVTFLACASIGATWACCSPDFGSRSVVDRFKQIDPKVLFAVDGYMYGGKEFNRLSVIEELQQALPTLQKTVLVPYLGADVGTARLKGVIDWEDLLKEESELIFEQVPFDHPLWVVYSSGTTGLPKGIVHGHGGVIIENFKYLGLQVDVKVGSRFFWFCTTGWVMWNTLQAGLLLGGTLILFDGNPGYPDMNTLWKLAENAGITIFGTSPAYLKACMNAGLKPGKTHDLKKLLQLGVTGSPMAPEMSQWAYDFIKGDLWLAPVSGGTDVATAFLGCSPLLPVYAAESQCRCLGVKAEAFSDKGDSLIDEVGEMVITEPMPSMPLFFWNDPENMRYRESYFEMFPGVWRHGDWLKVTSRGTAIISGRSDSTLKRMGVRMGSAEIYSAVEELPEVLSSLVIGLELKDDRYYMPLFVSLNESVTLDDALKAKINRKIRANLSPRHVPDDIFAIPEIPQTLNGKKLEVPVKKILLGISVEEAVNVDSMKNPQSLDFFVQLAGKLRVSD